MINCFKKFDKRFIGDSMLIMSSSINIDNPIVFTFEQEIRTCPHLPEGSNRIKQCLMALNQSHNYNPHDPLSEVSKECMDAHYNLRRTCIRIVKVNIYKDGSHKFEFID